MTEFTFSLQQLRDSLDDRTLKELLNREFKPDRLIKIKKRLVHSRFAEDELLTPSKLPSPGKRRKRKPTQLTPSMTFAKARQSFDQGLNEGTAETVLGVYFKLYLRLFGEEDAAWHGADMTKALSMVKLFASSVTGGNYRKIITFVKRIMPLWKYRLEDGCDFPGQRPTLEQLFNGKRYFWTNRKLIYKRWPRQQ